MKRLLELIKFVTPRFYKQWMYLDFDGDPCEEKSYWAGHCHCFEWLGEGFVYYVGESKPADMVMKPE